jgi:hypothetical protein
MLEGRCTLDPRNFLTVGPPEDEDLGDNSITEADRILTSNQAIYWPRFVTRRRRNNGILGEISGSHGYSSPL